MNPGMNAVLIMLVMIVWFTSCMNQGNMHIKTFESVWKKVNKTYYDPAEDAYKGPLVLLVDSSLLIPDRRQVSLLKKLCGRLVDLFRKYDDD